MRYTQNEFINKSKQVHGDKYDYSLVQYFTRDSKVIIICPIHGQFTQIASDHMHGKGCRCCGYDVIAQKCRSEFIDKAVAVHGNKYDYSEVINTNRLTAVKIKCPEHGIFLQRLHNHINSKQGCPVCAGITRHTTDDFITIAKEMHGNRYNYSKSNYISSKEKIVIICSKHGEFEQNAGDHMYGKGCSQCSTVISKPHRQLLDFIRLQYSGDVLENDRAIINPYEVDIYVPAKNLAFEFNGQYWHSFNTKEIPRLKTRHHTKANMAADANIQLIQVNEYEWTNPTKRRILESKIAHLLGLSIRVHGRKCVIAALANREYKRFILDNHIQGYKNASIRYGLRYSGEIVAIMSFSRHNKYQWELERFANRTGLYVVGGASKMFAAFIREHNPSSILSYADRRYSCGALYRKLGFELDDITKPNYIYIKGNCVFSRQQFQKHKLASRLEKFDPTKTEAENMFANGYRRMWDAGHFRFVFNKS